MEKVFASHKLAIGVMSPSLVSMNMNSGDTVSRGTRSMSIDDENDGTTILSVYDDYNCKSSTINQSQIYTISESKSVSENDDDDNDTQSVVGKIGTSSTNNPHLNQNDEDQQANGKLTANVLHAVRYNGASAFYEWINE